MRGHLPRGVPLPRPVVLVGEAPRFRLVAGSADRVRAVLDSPALPPVPPGRVRIAGAFGLPVGVGTYPSRLALDVLPDRLCPECRGTGELDSGACICVLRVAREHGVRGVDVLRTGA